MLNDMNLCEKIIPIAKAAGDYCLAYQQQHTNIDVQHKPDRSPVTQADYAAHDIIVSGLQKITPHIPILSEESDPIPYLERQQWQRYWLVDPLDGTREFIKKSGEFTVNIAFIEHGIAVLGVIYTPITATCYYAQRGQGAFKQNQTHAAIRIHTSQRQAKQTRIITSFRSARLPFDEVLALFPHYSTVRASSALKFCRIAEGLADIYPRLSPTCEWDSAAGQCIVEEAGGILCQLNLQPLRYNRKDSLINPYFLVFADRAFIDPALTAILQKLS